MEEIEVKQMDLVEIRNRAWKLCKNYLQGAWNDISAEEMILQELW